MNLLNHQTIDSRSNPETLALLSQLQHASTPAEIVEIIHRLGAGGNQSVVPPLIQLLNHHHPSVPTATVAALVQLAPHSVEPLLNACTTSKDQTVQAYMIQALAQIGDARAVDLLVDIVGISVANHCQGNVRRVAARGLGKIGRDGDDPEATRQAEEKLTWALIHPEDWGLRYAAVVSLAEIGTQSAYTVLEQALTTEADAAVQARIQLALKEGRRNNSLQTEQTC